MIDRLKLIPKFVQFCDWRYRIIVEPRPTTNEDYSRVCWGTCDDNNQIIKINADATIERAQETIIHEFIHVIDRRLLGGEDGFSEKQIVALSHGLRSLINGNPQLVVFLQEAQHEGE